MGLFNRLFGAPTPKAPPTPPGAVKRPPQKPAEKAAEKPQAAPAVRDEEAAVEAPMAEKETAAVRDDEAAAAKTHAPAARETFETATKENFSQEAAAEEDVPETAFCEKRAEAAKEDDRFAPEEVSAGAIDAGDVTVEPVDATVSAADTPTEFVDEAAALPGENAAANENAATDGTTADTKPAAAPEISEHLQKRLDTYFARLRQDFPDGCITRLNTAHKKLAERGAELRRLIGYEGRLDEFFALGGFTYRRGTSGRPSLPAEQTASVEERLRQQFPEDVPTLLAVQQADHRLYLDLRAAARRAGCTVGEYLDQFRAG